MSLGGKSQIEKDLLRGAKVGELCVHTLFGEENILKFQIKSYNEPPYYGCYWNYKKGNFHRIFEASKTSELTDGIYSIGEHFSLNPNWIEGSLESVVKFLKLYNE